MSYRRRRSGLLWGSGTPALVFADNFNRDEGSNLEDTPVSSSGYSWTWDGLIAGGIQIIEQNAHCMTANTSGTCYFTPDLGSEDMYVQYAAPSIANQTGGFMCVRLVDRMNFLGLRTGFESTPGQGTIEVFKRIGGTFTNFYVSPSANSFVQGDIVRLEAKGDTWTLKHEGTTLASGSIGSTLSSAKAGIVARTTSGGGICDDFQASKL